MDRLLAQLGMPSRSAVGAATLQASLHTWQGRVTPAPPFDLAQTLRVLAVSASVRDGLRAELDGSLTGGLSLDQRVVVFSLSPTTDAGLSLTLTGALPWTPPSIARATTAVDHFLALSDELPPFYALAAADPAFAPVVAAFHGYHPTRFPSAFEAACWAVLTQHNHMSIAGKMKRDLTHALGGSITLDGGDAFAAFPTPAQMAATSPQQLLATLKNEQRSIYLYGLAHAFRDSDTGLLTDAPYAEAEAWLRTIPGIGPWSAQFTLLRGVGRTDGPVTVDAPLLRAMVEVYGHDLVADAAQAKRLAESYRPHYVHWAHYLRVHSWLARKARGRRRQVTPAPATARAGAAEG